MGDKNKLFFLKDSIQTELMAFGDVPTVYLQTDFVQKSTNKGFYTLAVTKDEPMKSAASEKLV